MGSAFAGLLIEERVSSGGMGSVYRATDPILHRQVALKVIATALADDTSYRERFLIEARLAASLEHPAIVPVYSAGESEGRLYLAMRFMDDGSLGDLLDRSGPLAPGDAIRLLRPVADALDAAHRAGLIHRDVKPGNVLVEGDRAYLADFGLAVAASTGESMLSHPDPGLSGTMGYLAPEQIEGDRASAASDQYALACVLVECLTGRKPFARDNDLAVIYAHLQEPPPSLVALRPDLPRAVDAIVARGLAKRPVERYGSCRGLVDALESACALTARQAPAARNARRRWIAAAGFGLTAMAVAGALVLSAGGSPSAGPVKPAAGGDGIAIIDPISGKLTSKIPVGSGPLAIAAGGGSIWVVNADTRTISRIDAKSHRAVGPPFGLVDASPIGLTFADNALWVSTGSKFDKIDFATITDSVVRVDPATNLPGDPIRLTPKGTNAGFHHGGSQIAAGGGSIWVIDSGGSVERIDPATTIPSVVPGNGYEASAIAYGDGAAWVLGEHLDPRGGPPDGPWIWRIDPKTFARSQPIHVSTTGASDLTVGAGSVWVASPWDGLVFRVKPGPQNPQSTIVAPGATALSFDETAKVVWVVNPVDGTVQKIDPATNSAGTEAKVSGAPQAIAIAAGGVFASVVAADAQTPLRRAPGVHDVRLRDCSAVWGDPAAPPQLLIVGDFPFNYPLSRVDSDAVAAVLREHQFRAGSHTVGYQACDDRGGNVDTVCADHARAYANTSRVVGVITGFLSSCAADQLPALRAATGGPVAAIGPVNTADQLTSGKYENYARVTPTDGEHTAADVGVFLGSSAKRVFVLEESCLACPYVNNVSALFRKLGTGRVAIAGSETYGGDHGPRAQDVARTVDQSRATGVYLVGFPDTASGELLKALRTLKRDLVIVAPDSFIPVSDAILFAGDAATGVYVTSSNPPNGSLPPVGRQWLRRFAAAQLGGHVPTSSALAAAATEALLDAIARSDGSRASVAAKLLATKLPDSIIGPLRFTARGDIAACAISEYQIVGGTAFVPDIQSDLQGARFVKRIACLDPRSAADAGT